MNPSPSFRNDPRTAVAGVRGVAVSGRFAHLAAGWREPRLGRMGSGQLPTRHSRRMGSGQLPTRADARPETGQERPWAAPKAETA
jgi:hypothetical protein